MSLKQNIVVRAATLEDNLQLRELFSQFIIGDTTGKQIITSYYRAYTYKTVATLISILILIQRGYNYIFGFNQQVCFLISFATIAFWIIAVCPSYIHNHYRKIYTEHGLNEDFKDPYCFYTQGDSNLWVAEEQNTKKIVGCIAFHSKLSQIFRPLKTPDFDREGNKLENPKYGGLFRLIVHPQVRGQGVAQNLIQTCELHAKEKGYNAIYLFSFFFNVNAYQLFRKNKYIVSDTKYAPGTFLNYIMGLDIFEMFKVI